MTQNPRRTAFRLPWGEERDRSDEQPQDEPALGGQPQAAEAPSAAVSPAPPASSVSATPEPATADASPSQAASSDFLRELVGAMRAVAETSRESSVAQLRGAVESRVEELRARAGQEVEDLRRRSELDVTGIGEWERSEIERVRAEAERRREARRAQLEQQLADHQATSDREVEATQRRLADYERELAAFMAELADINDPTAFVATAKRMPPPPSLGGEPHGFPGQEGGDEGSTSGGRPAGDAGEAPAAPAPAEAGVAPAAEIRNRTLAERLAELDRTLATPGAGDQVAHPAPAETTADGETSTAIVVKGLASFGAITSFKQALERIEGVRGVTLSLGPTGEFVYRASHAAEFDLPAAIRSIEGPATGIERSEGTLQVTIDRSR